MITYLLFAALFLIGVYFFIHAKRLSDGSVLLLRLYQGLFIILPLIGYLIYTIFK